MRFLSAGWLTVPQQRDSVPDKIEIGFVGPYGLCGQHDRLLFGEPISAAAGIYLWTVRTRSGFVIEYIGETGESFAKRTKEHMIQAFGGNYRVCNAERLREGTAEVLWPGLWRKGSRDRMPEFAARYLELAPAILDYLRVIEVFLGPIEADRRFRQRVEGALARHIWDQPPPGNDLLPRDVRYRRRQEHEAPVSVDLRCSEDIIGIPDNLSA